METGRYIARWVRRAHVGVSSLLLAACAGNGQGLDANGRPLVPGSGGSAPPLSATFDSIQANIFTPICSVCHAGGSAPEGLRLDAANSYGLLVGVPSTEVPATLRVKPGDPDNSYLIQKLEGHAAVGAQMPFGCPTTQPCLPSATIAFVRQWITDGAVASASVASAATATGAAAAFTVTSMAPEDTETVSEPPPQLMIAFSRELDVTQIVGRTARIERIAADAASALPASIPAQLTVSADNLRAVMLWPSRPLTSGRYRAVISGSPEFHDIAGQAVSLGVLNEAGDSVIATFEIVQ